MHTRHAEIHLRDALADTPVVVIHGARQTGKSTLARAMSKKGPGPSREYITLDDLTMLSAAADPASFIQSRTGPIVIDEVQRAPGLFLPIKKAVDENRQPGRFLLTGSTNVMLLPQLSDALVGRVEIVPLWPLSQGEIEGRVETFIDRVFAPKLSTASASIIDTPLHTRILMGGYPEALTRSDDARRAEWFASYISTVLERGAQDIAAIEGLAELPNLLALIASRTSGLLNFADLSRGLGMPLTTLKRYIGFLRATFMVVTIPAWTSNRGLRLTKAPKVMLGDTGLACHLEHADEARLAKDGNLRGRMLENFIAMELLKQSDWSQAKPTLHHYRTPAGAEVDLVLERRGGDVVGIEVKSSVAVDWNDFRGLHSLAEAADKNFVRGIVLYNGEHTLPFGPNMYAVPINALWGAE